MNNVMKRKRIKRIGELSSFQQLMLTIKTRLAEYFIQDRFSSFLQVGDIVELQYVSPYDSDQHIGEPKIYTVENIRILPNSHGERPTEFVIVFKLSYNEGKSSTECTSDRFKYIKHLYPDQKQIDKRCDF
jgi:hypothetical protein